MVLDQSNFPEIKTFSSVIRYSLCFEEAAQEFYTKAAGLLSGQAELLNSLAETHQKRYVLLEDTRQQKLNEMILEPISDVCREDFLPDTALDTAAEVKTKALALETLGGNFYEHLSKVSKELSREAAKVYARMAKENEKLKGKLAEL
ncbi:MAG: hypothetical protein KQJ78_02180 [Deltaproteobacteria bacterium]|nr:hypothetical protein [Deltaproteobacteria bacterium]